MADSQILPPARPRLTADAVSKLLAHHGVTEAVAMLGVRGYYRDTMGVPGENDRGIYDDAIFIQAPAVTAAFNANTDPSRHRQGIASLRCGTWRYRIGIHGLSKPRKDQYVALVQAAPVTVDRDNAAAETGWFGINIHRGGFGTTSSLGCQTIYPDQWRAFIASVQDQLARNNQHTLPYVLIEGPVA
jgi:lysozyme